MSDILFTEEFVFLGPPAMFLVLTVTLKAIAHIKQLDPYDALQVGIELCVLNFGNHITLLLLSVALPKFRGDVVGAIVLAGVLFALLPLAVCTLFKAWAFPQHRTSEVILADIWGFIWLAIGTANLISLATTHKLLQSG